MKHMIMIGCVLLMVGVPVSVKAGEWSEYTTVSTEGNSCGELSAASSKKWSVRGMES